MDPVLPFAGFLLVLVVVGLVGTVLWVLSLVDALRFTDAEYAQAGQNKVLWVILVVLLGLLGSLLYVLMPRPHLQRVRAARP